MAGADEAELTMHGRRLPITEYFGLAESEALFNRHFESVLQGNSVRFEINLNPPHGESRWVEISMNRIR